MCLRAHPLLYSLLPRLITASTTSGRLDNAQLYLGVREDARHGIREALQTVHAGYQDVLHATVLEVGQDPKPEVGALALGHVHAQQLLPSLAVQGEDIVYRPRDRTVPLVHHLVVDGVKPYYGVDALQGTAPPALDLGKDTVGYAAYLPGAVAYGLSLEFFIIKIAHIKNVSVKLVFSFLDTL